MPEKPLTYIQRVKNTEQKLEEEKKEFISEISGRRFLKRIEKFTDEKQPHWEVGMKSFDSHGEWQASQYKFLSAPKTLTVADFMVHYTKEFHEQHFHKHEHRVVNYLLLYDCDPVEGTSALEPQLILVYTW